MEEENSVTMVDVLKEQEAIEEDANAVLGASDDKNCTYLQGYIKRQALYACLTCCPESVTAPEHRAGVCLACSLACHENHSLVELYTKRNFRCDCAGPKFPSNCSFNPKRSENNNQNEYNHNFSGLYCTCQKPYPDPDDNIEDEMIQCIVCEDWFHSRHLNAKLPAAGLYTEMICESCTDKNEFLEAYMCYEANHNIANEKSSEEQNIEVENNSENANEEHDDTENENPESLATAVVEAHNNMEIDPSPQISNDKLPDININLESTQTDSQTKLLNDIVDPENPQSHHPTFDMTKSKEINEESLTNEISEEQTVSNSESESKQETLIDSTNEIENVELTNNEIVTDNDCPNVAQDILQTNVNFKHEIDTIHSNTAVEVTRLNTENNDLENLQVQEDKLLESPNTIPETNDKKTGNTSTKTNISTEVMNQSSLVDVNSDVTHGEKSSTDYIENMDVDIAPELDQAGNTTKSNIIDAENSNTNIIIQNIIKESESPTASIEVTNTEEMDTATENVDLDELKSVPEQSNVEKMDTATEESNIESMKNTSEESNIGEMDIVTEEANLPGTKSAPEESTVEENKTARVESNIKQIEIVTEKSNIEETDPVLCEEMKEESNVNKIKTIAEKSDFEEMKTVTEEMKEDSNVEEMTEESNVNEIKTIAEKSDFEEMKTVTEEMKEDSNVEEMTEESNVNEIKTIAEKSDFEEMKTVTEEMKEDSNVEEMTEESNVNEIKTIAEKSDFEEMKTITEEMKEDSNVEEMTEESNVNEIKTIAEKSDFEEMKTVTEEMKEDSNVEEMTEESNVNEIKTITEKSDFEEMKTVTEEMKEDSNVEEMTEESNVNEIKTITEKSDFEEMKTVTEETKEESNVEEIKTITEKSDFEELKTVTDEEMEIATEESNIEKIETTNFNTEKPLLASEESNSDEMKTTTDELNIVQNDKIEKEMNNLNAETSGDNLNNECKSPVNGTASSNVQVIETVSVAVDLINTENNIEEQKSNDQDTKETPKQNDMNKRSECTVNNIENQQIEAVPVLGDFNTDNKVSEQNAENLCAETFEQKIDKKSTNPENPQNYAEAIPTTDNLNYEISVEHENKEQGTDAPVSEQNVEKLANLECPEKHSETPNIEEKETIATEGLNDTVENGRQACNGESITSDDPLNCNKDMHNLETQCKNLNTNGISTTTGNSHFSDVSAKKRKPDSEYPFDSESPIKKKIKQEKVYIAECIKPACSIPHKRKGATFWPADWRSKLCSCKSCSDMYYEKNIAFIIDLEDTVCAYEDLGKIKTESCSQYEKGMEALSSLGHVQQINAITEYNKMKEKLLEFLKTFKDKKEVVKEEDIKSFFAGMKPKREPDGVYFCR